LVFNICGIPAFPGFAFSSAICFYGHRNEAIVQLFDLLVLGPLPIILCRKQPPIFMSLESLRLLMNKPGRIKIYVDPSNANNYFFDVRFLHDIVL